jgi:hypothetical protein
MTEETETLKTIVNHPIYKKFTKSEIPKLAQKKLKLHHIARKQNLNLVSIFKQPEHDFWIAHITAILRHHRSMHRDEFLPSNLPSGTKVAVAEHLTTKHRPKVDALFQKLKTKHDKLEKEIKSSVKKRI